ncbi:LacI family DNA-binding transcriptional regulator [Isoptericola sp. b490]|uniref:LacI family DNA-binding transcriptional regulator n=1 Tax=Actinotalea lenta TaxID=3064654 RepID=UPI002713ABBC|nr:LacI family DNA-binding transcriptional regulator [Isoptericola sp. b490]MDO8121539.1 LacI family DNA-binding transcriptional regulator [Isoptericola sp. b490]
MAGRVTVRDVARRAEVSTATVSRVVNGTARVAEGTSRRVAAAIDELGYPGGPAAQARTRHVALVVPSITNPFFPELVTGARAALARSGYSLLLVDAEDPEAEARRLARSRLVDGILLVGSHTPRPRRGPGQPRVPVVAIDRTPTSWRAPVVECDSYQGARTVTAHLASTGHSRIAHLAGPAHLDVAARRRRGYRDALRERGLRLDPTWVVRGDFSEESGHRAALRLLEVARPPTAIFAANDLMAVGALAALRGAGVRVPQDMAVAGFDGIRVGRYTLPTLTTYAQPVLDMSRRAVVLLLAAIRDPTGPSAATPPLPGRLVVRESTGGPP